MNAKTKLQSLGFTSSHAKLLTVAVAAFSLLIFAKSDVSIRTMFVNADDEVVMLTYEDTRQQVIEDNGFIESVDNTEADKIFEEQMALLDRGALDGKVLGEAIGIGEIPNADQLQLPEISSQIKTIIAPYDDYNSRKQYAAATTKIETDTNVTSLLADLNGTDTEVISRAVTNWQKVIDQLSNTPVPQSLAEFHKSKITFYAIWMNIGKIYAGDKSDDDLQLLTKAMLGYSQKVENLRTELSEKYQLSL